MPRFTSQPVVYPERLDQAILDIIYNPRQVKKTTQSENYSDNHHNCGTIERLAPNLIALKKPPPRRGLFFKTGERREYFDQSASVMMMPQEKGSSGEPVFQSLQECEPSVT